MLSVMDIAHWPSRPSSRWPDVEEETELRCLGCQQWKPWHYYSKHSPLFPASASYRTFFDLGGHRWACDRCVGKSMREEGLWTITDKHGELVPPESRSDSCN